MTHRSTAEVVTMVAICGFGSAALHLSGGDATSLLGVATLIFSVDWLTPRFERFTDWVGQTAEARRASGEDA